MFLSLSLVITCVLCQRFILDKKVSGDHLEFSGNALINQKMVWVLITGSLIHATPSHELNNLMFTFCVSYIAETQLLLSYFWMIAVFTVTGIAGWITSFLYHYYRHGMLAYFIPARGYSPNMYGACFFCMIVYPQEIMQNVLLLPPVIWILLIVALPAYLTNNKNHNKFIWTALVIILCGITYSIYTYTSLLTDITMGGFIGLYFVKCIISYTYFVGYLGNPSSADHACHLGGSVSGIFLGVLYLYLYSKPWPYDRVDVHVWTAITRLDFLYPLFMLFFRLIYNI